MGHSVEGPRGDDLCLQLNPSPIDVGVRSSFAEAATCLESPDRDVLAFNCDVGIIGKNRPSPPDGPQVDDRADVMHQCDPPGEQLILLETFLVDSGS